MVRQWDYPSIRRELAARSGHRVTLTEFDVLLGTGLIAAIRSPEEESRADILLQDLGDVLADIREIQDAEAARRIPAHREEHRATTAVQSALARRIPAIQRFREEVLEGRMLRLAQVENWLDGIKAVEGTGSIVALVRVPARASSAVLNSMQSGKLDPEVLDTCRVEGIRRRYLSFPRSGFPRIGVRSVDDCGATGRLKQLAEVLIGEFGWLESEAVGFILADKLPDASLGTTHVRTRTASRAFARIVLEVDSRLGPNEVKSEYSRARREVLQSREPQMRRHKPVGRKACELAMLRAENLHASAEELHSKWNSSNPDWVFVERKEFKRAMARAYQAVAGHDWDELQDWLGRTVTACQPDLP